MNIIRLVRGVLVLVSSCSLAVGVTALFRGYEDAEHYIEFVKPIFKEQVIGKKEGQVVSDIGPKNIPTEERIGLLSQHQVLEARYDSHISSEVAMYCVVGGVFLLLISEAFKNSKSRSQADRLDSLSEPAEQGVPPKSDRAGG